MATYYATGTASVANGATSVTGSGTDWVTNGVQAGDYFAANGLRVRISAVNSATSITLATAWPGTSLSGNNYEIQFTPVATRVLSQVNTLLASLGNGIVTALAGLSAAADKLPYFTGSASMSMVDFKSWARSFIGSSTLANGLTSLGLGTGSEPQFKGLNLKTSPSFTIPSNYNSTIQTYGNATGTDGTESGLYVQAGYIAQTAVEILRLSAVGASYVDTPRMVVMTSGKVGIGTTTPATTLQVAGTIAPGVDNSTDLGTASLRFDDIFATNATIQTSDERNKDDIADIPYGLDLINALRPVSYKWKDLSKPAVTETRQKRQQVRKDVQREVESIVNENGKWVTKIETVTVNEPVFDEFPVYDEEGNKVPGRTHRVPRMETVEEVVEISPAIERSFGRKHFGLIAQEVKAVMDAHEINGKDFAAFIHDPETDTYGMRYGELIPVLIKACQDLSARCDALQAQLDA